MSRTCKLFTQGMNCLLTKKTLHTGWSLQGVSMVLNQ